MINKCNLYKIGNTKLSRKKRKIKHNNNDTVVNFSSRSNFSAKNEYETGKIKKTFHLKDLNQIYPKTENQELVFHSWNNKNHILLKGSAGSGKTFLGLYLALVEVLDPETAYDRVIIVRSAVPTRDIGHLPGTEDEKLSPYEDPYRGLCDELFEFRKSYDNLKGNDYVEFKSTSHIRGITLNNAIVVVDEAQNLTSDELSSIITRCGQDTRYIICGDTKQSDAKGTRDRSSLDRLERILDHVKSFDTVTFNRDDIVRSGLVREFIIAEEDHGE